MTESNSPILHVYQLDDDGTWSDQTETADTDHPKEKLTWYHVEFRNPNTPQWVEDNLGFLDPILRTALLADDPRPRIEEYEDGLLVLLRAANLNEGQNPHDMVSVRMWVDAQRIVTLQGRYVRAIKDLASRLFAHNPPKTAGDVLSHLNAKLIDRMENVIGDLDEITDDLEAQVIEDPDAKTRQGIIALRHRAIMFRRFIAPQRDVLSRLRNLEHPLISKKNKLSLQDSLDHLQRYLEDIDTVRDRAQVIQDELMNALSEKLNARLYLLSIITAIFLPLGFVTGLLGINVGGLPGVDNSSAFAIVCVGIGIVVLLQVIWFKWMKWF